MRRPARGAKTVAVDLWPLAVLASALWAAGCATADYRVEAVDTVTVAKSTAEVPETLPEAQGEASEGAPEVATSDTPLPEAQDESLNLRGIAVDEVAAAHRLVFDLSRTPDSIDDFRLTGPPRIVLDLHGPHEAARVVDRYPADDPFVRRVRVGHYDGRMRLVVDLSDTAPQVYSFNSKGRALVVYLGERDETADDRASHEGSQESPGEIPQEDPEVNREEGATETAARDNPGHGDTSLTGDAQAPGLGGADTAGPTERAGARNEASGRAGGGSDASASDRPALAAEPPLPRPRLARLKAPSDRQKKFTGKRISLDFKDADVQNVLRVIADVSKLNIVATDDVSGRITLHLVDVPWDLALDVVLKSNRLKMVREGNVLRISTVERVREEQEELRAQQLAEKELEPLQVRYVRVNYARADKALLEKVQSVLTDRGSAAFDERTNTIIVRDIGRGIEDAVELIRNVDVQSPQVLIEANIVEGTTDFAQALGVQWGYRHLAGPQTGNPTGSDFPGTVDLSGGALGLGKPAPPGGAGVPQPLVPLIADFPVPDGFGPGFGRGSGSALDLALGSISGQHTLSARLTALEDQGKGRIISRPRVITLNNIPARIESLTIFRVRLPSTGTVVNTGVGGVAGSSNSATEQINTGIILVVTPQVSSDGYVLLNINAKSSTADFAKSVDEIPAEVSREATSNVLVKDGETVVLGGIFRNESGDTETGIPYLRRVPALGWLFKRVTKRDSKEELLVFITPQVVAGYGAELPSAVELWENRQTTLGGGLAASYQ